MADLFSINKLKNALSEYLKIKFELFKLDLTEHLANVLAQLLAYAIILIMTSLVLLFSSMGISFLLNELLNSSYLGFIITAGFYLLLLLIIFIFLKTGKLKSFFEDKLVPPSEPEAKTKNEE